jgi:hypothetical protein
MQAACPPTTTGSAKMLSVLLSQPEQYNVQCCLLGPSLSDTPNALTACRATHTLATPPFRPNLGWRSGRGLEPRTPSPQHHPTSPDPLPSPVKLPQQQTFSPTGHIHDVTTSNVWQQDAYMCTQGCRAGTNTKAARSRNDGCSRSRMHSCVADTNIKAPRWQG